MHNDCLQEVLKVYDELRRPRSQRVADLSHQAGKVYNFHGPHGPSAQGIRTDLEGMQDYPWGYVLDEDVKIAAGKLTDRGVWH